MTTTSTTLETVAHLHRVMQWDFRVICFLMAILTLVIVVNVWASRRDR